MNEKDIITKIEKEISALTDEFNKDYDYMLLTHVINLEFTMGKIFAYLDVLEDISIDSFVKVYETHRPLFNNVTAYVDKQYQVLRKV